MENNAEWKDQFEKEIAHGLVARQRGNEGMARVCARRAAGIAIKEFFAQREVTWSKKGSSQPLSAYDYLKILDTMENVPAGASESARLLLLRVTPDYALPIEADLLEQAQRLRKLLLG